MSVEQSQENHLFHRQHSHHHSSIPINRSILSPHRLTSHDFYNLHNTSIDLIPSQQQTIHHQQRTLYNNELNRNSKESISIQDFMKKNVNEFVALTGKNCLFLHYKV